MQGSRSNLMILLKFDIDYDNKLLQMDTIRIYDSLRSTTGYNESSLQKYDSQGKYAFFFP